MHSVTTTQAFAFAQLSLHSVFRDFDSAAVIDALVVKTSVPPAALCRRGGALCSMGPLASRWLAIMEEEHPRSVLV